MSKWIKIGVVRLSQSKKVVLLGIEKLGRSKWLIVDVGELLDLIDGSALEIPIFEAAAEKSE